MFAQTLAQSRKPLYMLFFMTMIGTIISSSLMYYAERGEYDRTLKQWQHVSHYLCPTYVRVDLAEGETLPEYPGLKYANPYGPCTPVDLSEDGAHYAWAKSPVGRAQAHRAANWVMSAQSAMPEGRALKCLES